LFDFSAFDAEDYASFLASPQTDTQHTLAPEVCGHASIAFDGLSHEHIRLTGADVSVQEQPACIQWSSIYGDVGEGYIKRSTRLEKPNACIKEWFSLNNASPYPTSDQRAASLLDLVHLRNRSRYV
jgi:hypothetical protein